MATVILKTTYVIRTVNAADDVLQFDITVQKDAGAVPSVSTLTMMAFIRDNLQALVPDPVTLQRVQTVQTDELGV